MAGLWFYIAAFITLYTATKHFLNKIRNFPPSPFPSLPVIGHLLLFRDPIHRCFAELAGRYGPLLFLRLGNRRILLVSSPAAVEECLNKNDVVFADRPRLIIGEYFGYNFTTINAAPYGDLWRNLRRFSSTVILSPQRLHLLASFRADEVRSLLRRIYQRAPLEEGSGYKVVDLKSAFLETTTNVMTRMLAGRRYYGDGEESEEGTQFKALMREIGALGGLMTVGDFIPLLRWFGVRGAEKRFKAVFEKTDAFMQNLVDDYKKRRSVEAEEKTDFGSQHEIDNKNKCMIEVLLSLQESDSEFYTEQIIKGLVLVMLQIGTEAASGTMEWMLSFLLNNPTSLKKAKAEIDAYVGHDRLIEESDLSHLPYLQSVILETLRLRPVLPLIVHLSTEECTVGGYRVPRGTILMVNVWAMHHSREIWEEASEFKPERFDGVQGNRVGFKTLPFGLGRRSCPGEGLGMRMVGLALGSVIQCFEWERVGEEMVDMQESVGVTAPKVKPLVANCRPRKQMVKLYSH